MLPVSAGYSGTVAPFTAVTVCGITKGDTEPVRAVEC